MAYGKTGSTRKPSRAQARSEEIWKKVADDLVERLQSGKLDWSSGWTESARPTNPTTGNGYKGINNLLLRYVMWARGTEDPRFCGFEQAKTQGWSVRKGSEGIPLRRYIEILVDEKGRRVAGQAKMSPAEKREYLNDHKGSRLTGTFKYIYVFSALDIDGIEPYRATPKKEIDDRTVEALIAASPCPVIESQDVIPCYSRSADVIAIPRRSQFVDLPSLATTLLHEQVHATGHEKRLNRPEHKVWGDEIYAREELIAELGSALAFSELGLVYPAVADEFTADVKNNTSAYLASWASSLGDPVEEVRAAFSDAARAAAMVCDGNEALLREGRRATPDHELSLVEESDGPRGAALADIERQARAAAEGRVPTQAALDLAIADPKDFEGIGADGR